MVLRSPNPYFQIPCLKSETSASKLGKLYPAEITNLMSLQSSRVTLVTVIFYWYLRYQLHWYLRSQKYNLKGPLSYLHHVVITKHWDNDQNLERCVTFLSKLFKHIKARSLWVVLIWRNAKALKSENYSTPTSATTKWKTYKK